MQFTFSELCLKERRIHSGANLNRSQELLNEQPNSPFISATSIIASLPIVGLTRNVSHCFFKLVLKIGIKNGCGAIPFQTSSSWKIPFATYHSEARSHLTRSAIASPKSNDRDRFFRQSSLQIPSHSAADSASQHLQDSATHPHSDSGLLS